MSVPPAGAALIDLCGTIDDSGYKRAARHTTFHVSGELFISLDETSLLIREAFLTVE